MSVPWVCRIAIAHVSKRLVSEVQRVPVIVCVDSASDVMRVIVSSDTSYCVE